MIYDSEFNSLQPEKGKDLPKKLIDYSVFKKGVKAAAPKPAEKTKAQEDDYLAEEERLRKKKLAD